MTSEQSLIRDMLTAATLLPLFSSVVLIFIGHRVLKAMAGWFAVLVMVGSFACSLVGLMTWLGPAAPGPVVWNVPWIPLAGMNSWLTLGLLADSLTVAMMVMVSGISLLVHLYSVGYMRGDKRFARFFAYLSLFTFAMLSIVTANGLVQLLVGWELVGLTSYLLIGFWYEKRGPRLACTKAWVMNRIGDMGFLIGFGVLFYHVGDKLLLPASGAADQTSMFEAIKTLLEAEGHSITHPPLWLTVAGIGLFFGAIGKSAQFPLHTWLPDAMEGPTPVSSIVHSATMVAAGVYLTARLYPILTPDAHLFVASIGLITLIIAAAMAMVMTDIKRVLAYSTLSQLGYMILGLGAGAYTFALFHLITHAFFKCCLFQCAGSVIHAAHHEQDMRQYGGLWKKLPITGTCFLVCTLAIAGASIPYTQIGISGFFSKDGIIAGTFNYGQALTALGPWANLFWLGPTVVAYITVFYMGRAFALTFLGKPRNQQVFDHAHEAPWTMWVPQVCLAGMAVLSAPMLMGLWKQMVVDSEPAIAWVQRAADLDHGHAMHLTHAALLQGLAWIIMLLVGIGMYRGGMAFSSRLVRLPGLNLLYTWTLNKFYFDALYDVFTVGLTRFLAGVSAFLDKWLIDGLLVNGSAWVTKMFAFGVGRFDNNVIDGAVNGAALAAQGGGQLLRSSQAGRVRGYVLGMFLAAAVITLLALVAVLSGQ